MVFELQTLKNYCEWASTVSLRHNTISLTVLWRASYSGQVKIKTKNVTCRIRTIEFRTAKFRAQRQQFERGHQSQSTNLIDDVAITKEAQTL